MLEDYDEAGLERLHWFVENVIDLEVGLVFSSMYLPYIHHVFILYSPCIYHAFTRNVG
jgi:hypothetical protein